MFTAGFITGAVALAIVTAASLPWYSIIIVYIIVSATGESIAKLILDC